MAVTLERLIPAGTIGHALRPIPQPPYCDPVDDVAAFNEEVRAFHADPPIESDPAKVTSFADLLSARFDRLRRRAALHQRRADLAEGEDLGRAVGAKKRQLREARDARRAEIETALVEAGVAIGHALPATRSNRLDAMGHRVTDPEISRLSSQERELDRYAEKLVNSRFDDRDAAQRINEILAAAMGQLLNVADM